METNWEQNMPTYSHNIAYRIPWVPESFFSFCLLRKLSGEATIVTSEKKIHPKQQENKPSGTQGTYRID